MAMDGDEKTYFKSFYGMGDKDDFQILLSRPIPLRSLRVVTGNGEKQNLLTDGFVEISPDGAVYTKAATFNNEGIAEATLTDMTALSLRIKLNRRRGLPSLLLREITLDSPVKIAHIQWGAGRAFSDFSAAPELESWARKAEHQMEEFWPDTAALLYSDGFITPNKVNVVYRTGPNVTPVAATGGGEMTVNTEWCRKQPNDTGLTVHEVAHVIQAMSAYNPVWLIEGIADYIRWVKFEPQNHKPRINVQTSKYSDSYRTTATFLAWCELHYDSRLVTKLNHDVRFGHFKIDLFKKYCGKDVDTLWAEFIEDYKKDPENIITPPMAAADRPRTLPTVAEGAGTTVDLAAIFNGKGIFKDGREFRRRQRFRWRGRRVFSGITWHGAELEKCALQNRRGGRGQYHRVQRPNAAHRRQFCFVVATWRGDRRQSDGAKLHCDLCRWQHTNALAKFQRLVCAAGFFRRKPRGKNELSHYAKWRQRPAPVLCL